ncbi:MAG: hypothetical protein GY816_23135, partial [Cytophagales bacterium]|nr:hypothetical protein [Cytophagales bacterium]
MEPLIGVYGLKQLGMRFYTPDKIDLLGSPASPEEKDQLVKVEQAVKLPRTKYTQINLLKCYSAKPLRLGPLRKGKIQMKASESLEKGVYLFTPSFEGIQAGLKVSPVKICKARKFKVEVINPNKGESISLPWDVPIGTVGRAELKSFDQVRLKLEKDEIEKREKLEANQRLQREGLYDGRADKLVEILPIGENATQDEKDKV